MQDLWGDEVKTYKFFTYACPRLYDLNTVAYWILQNGAHSFNFKANLEHVTQVSIEVSHIGAQLFLRVTKAEGKYSSDMDTKSAGSIVICGEIPDLILNF